jgi:hypothetical protein
MNWDYSEKELKCEWDVVGAVFEYRLYGKLNNRVELIATGDFNWADRTAKHYDLSMPEAGDAPVQGS